MLTDDVCPKHTNPITNPECKPICLRLNSGCVGQLRLPRGNSIYRVHVAAAGGIPIENGDSDKELMQTK